MKTIKILLSVLLFLPLLALLSVETEEPKIVAYQLIGLVSYGGFVFIIVKYSNLFKSNKPDLKGLNIDPKLVEFLQNEGVLEQFMENTANYSYYPDKPCNKQIKCVDEGFIWAVSPQGHEFWSKLNEKYEEIRSNS